MFKVHSSFNLENSSTLLERTLLLRVPKVVWDYLVQNFKLDDSRVRTKGLGKTTGAGDVGKVQILVHPIEQAVPTVKNKPEPVKPGNQGAPQDAERDERK